MIKKDLLFVIPTLNRYEGVVELIHSVEAGTIKPTSYLIIDNGGDFVKKVKANSLPIANIDIFEPGRNIGVAASWNFGLAKNYEYTILAADDSLVKEDTIEQMLLSASARNDAFVYPTFVNGGKHSDWAFFLQRKALTKKIGLYDERFWPGYFEDNDYGRRLKLHGVESIHSVNAKVFHIGGGTSTQFNWHVRFELNKLRYIEKWGGNIGFETKNLSEVRNLQDADRSKQRDIISIIIPHLSLGDERREEGLQRCLSSIMNQTYGATNFQIIIAEGDGTVPEKVAKGLKDAYGKYVVFAANDMEFEANAILFAWEDSVRNQKDLVSLNGGNVLPDEGNICEHFLIKKDFINRLEKSELFSTDFHHTCVDNWLWAQAKVMNQAMRSERSKYVHYHFSKPGGFMDKVYEKGWNKEKLEKDRNLLKQKIDSLNTNKKKLKIVAYTITKNEEKFIERYCLSAKDADEVIIIDTGSTDKTVEIAQKCGATVHKISISPWRFDVARNASMALLPADADVCMAIDADEIFEKGWREEIERVWVPGTTRLRYLYDWGQNVQFMCDKIHARKGYVWKHPCHERLMNDARMPEIFSETKKLLVKHLPDLEKSRGQYLDLLKLAAKEDPHCPRNAFYYARELTFYGMNEEAIDELKRYLKLPASTWKDERAFAMRLIGKSIENIRGLDDGALYWFEKGTKEAPHRRETWFALTEAYYRRQMWKECAETAEKTLLVNTNKNDWPVEPAAWDYLTHDYLAISSYYLNDRDKAMKQGLIALSMQPNNDRLKKNIEWYATTTEEVE